MDKLCEQCTWWMENGDGSQRVCTICHPEYCGFSSKQCSSTSSSTTAITFPSNDDSSNNIIKFPEENDDGDDDDIFSNVIPWRDVPQNEWILIVCINKIKTVHGPSSIITLRQRHNNETLRAWSTTLITEAIERKQQQHRHDKEHHLFIKSLGKAKCKKSNNFFYNFKLRLL